MALDWLKKLFFKKQKYQKNNDIYYIDSDRSTALYYVEILDDRNVLQVTFQKTPGVVYEYYINTAYKQFVKEFFSEANANETRSWGKTYHLLLRLNWILPK